MKDQSRPDKPSHPIQVVANRTGLTPDVIRAWERRYAAVEPSRSAAKRRLYSDAEVERLALLHRATRAGRRIGDVAQLPTDELETLVQVDERAVAASAASRTPPTETRAQQYLLDCVRAVEDLDTVALESSLGRAALALNTDSLIDGVLTPLLAMIGDGWRRGGMRIHQEHMTTSLVRSLLEMMRISHARRSAGPDIIVATPAGQIHELGALMAAVIAATEGWRVTYLGADLPAEEIAAAASTRHAAVVALSIVHPSDDAQLAGELGRLESLLGENVAVLVGGCAVSAYGRQLSRMGAICPESFQALRAELSRLRSSDGST